MRAWLVALTFATVMALPRGALAQAAGPEALAVPPPNATVLLVPPTCTTSHAVDFDAFAGILTAELRQDGVERVVPAQGSSALATIAVSVDPCDPSTRDVVVTIEDLVTAKRVVRRILLQDVADQARPRALALAVAELLRASWLELALPKAPTPALPVPPAVREAVLRRMAAALPPRPEPTVRDLDAALESSLTIAWRAFLSGNASLLGARGALAFPFYSKSLILRFDGGGVYGTAHDALGDVHLGLASTSASLLYATPLARPTRFEVGPRIELGVAWASGNPGDPQTSSYAGVGYVGDASVLGMFLVRLAPTWRLAMELEAGGVFAPFDATADGRRVTGVRGGMFGLAVGLLNLR